MNNVASINPDEVEQHLQNEKNQFEREQSEPVDPNSIFESPDETGVPGSEETAEDDDNEEDQKIDIYSLQPTEFIEMYKALSAAEKRYLYDKYKEVLTIRDKMTQQMTELKEWCDERNIDFPTYKVVYKRANDPKKKQNMCDATFVFFGKELGGGMQQELFSASTTEQ